MKKGDRVRIVNSTLDGEQIIEGEAELLRCLSDDHQFPRWDVRFDNGDVVTRFIFTEQQISELGL